MRQCVGAAVVKTLEMGSRDRYPDIADLDIGLFLCVDDRFADALLDREHVDDLPLADAPRRGLTHSENANLIIRATFGDNDADLGGADLKSDKNLFVRHRREKG